MDNITTYLKYRSDITFEERTFNEVDALILSLVVYFPFGDIINECGSITLNDVCKIYISNHTEEEINKIFMFSPRLYQFLQVISSTKRFQNVLISNYKEINDRDEITQFAAMTFKIKKKFIFIAYRGTDNSVLGWQENLKMLYQKEVAGYNYAYQYFKECVKDNNVGIINKTNFMLGGHSKGGNLAMAAYLKNNNLSHRVSKVFNFDGPGFSENFINNYNSNLFLKITQYAPIQSIVGRMFEHQENIIIVDSYDEGIVQHDPTCWKIYHNGFVELEEFSNISDETNQFFNELIYCKDNDTKERFATVLSRILTALEIDNLSQFKEIKIQKAFQTMLDLRTLKPDERKFVLDLLRYGIGHTVPGLFHKKTD